MNNQRSFFFNVDWVTVFIYLLLCAIGWFNIRAAVYDPTHTGILDFKTDYSKQFWYIIFSLGIGTVILLLESRFITALAPAFYIISLILLILVLVIGRNVGGNQAWLSLGGGLGYNRQNLQSLQPVYF